MAISHPEFGSRLRLLRQLKHSLGISEVEPSSLQVFHQTAWALLSLLHLVAHAPRLLILASRTPSKVNAVVRDILSSYPNVRIDVVAVDLSTLKSLRRAAEDVKKIVGMGKKGGGAVDVLFNNAGITISGRKLTDEGIEMQFGTNHVGPFLFTKLLLPLILQSPSDAAGQQKMIINTSSEAHRISPVRLSDWNLDPGKTARGEVENEAESGRGMPKGILRGGGRYEMNVAYVQSESANVLFTVGLNSLLVGRS